MATKVKRKNIKAKKENLEPVKKIKIANKLSDETYTLIKTIIIVVIFFAISYLIVLLLDKVGVLDKRYDPALVTTPEISYSDAIIGTVFNRPDSVYYVAFDDFSGENSNVYFTYLINNATTETQIYKVDMSLGINAKNLSEEGNPSAQSSNELKINGPTLIKVNNGMNILYLTDIELIKKELMG